jgi:hypothetical protein
MRKTGIGDCRTKQDANVNIIDWLLAIDFDAHQTKGGPKR